MAGGVESVTIDGVAHSGIAGGTVFTPDDWDAATDRYLIDNTAGASSLTLDRTVRLVEVRFLRFRWWRT